MISFCLKQIFKTNLIRHFLIITLLNFTIVLLNGFNSAQLIADTTLFTDNFDGYAVGSFPSGGGWQLIYNGSGSGSQFVDNTHSVSPLNGLHLVGSSCWSANAFHAVTLPNLVRLEGSVFIESVVGGGCTPTLALFGLNNPNVGAWGTNFGAIAFGNDGKIYANEGSYDSVPVPLTSYSPGEWYYIQEDLNLTTRLFNVYINGVLYGSGLEIKDSGMPTGVNISAGHGDYPTVWYDNIKVSQITATVPEAPTSVMATAGNAQATVTFTSPASDGGSPITGYTVTSNPAGGVDANAGSTSTTHTLTGLTNGTVYTFTAAATNVIGTGPASDPSNSVTPSSPQTGSLTVTISPDAALSAGARWNVDSGTWQQSGATVSNLSVAIHTVSFNSVTGWSKPSDIKINVQGGQTATASGTYTQANQFKADFTATPTSGKAPLAVKFTDKSTGTVKSRLWEFGDGKTGTSQNPSYTYTKPGTYTVKLTVTRADGAKNTKTQTNLISVYAAPKADFSATPIKGKVPLTVKFTDKSTGGATSWSWSFGDGQSSTEQNPAHTYSKAGKYSVTLTIRNPSGTSTKTKTNFISVSDSGPVADFSADSVSGKIPFKVTFTDKSTGNITKRSWKFGDGGSSTAKNPVYTYKKAGTYTVTLTVSGAGGSNTMTKTNYITATSSPPPGYCERVSEGNSDITVKNNSTSMIQVYFGETGEVPFGMDMRIGECDIVGIQIPASYVLNFSAEITQCKPAATGGCAELFGPTETVPITLTKGQSKSITVTNSMFK